MHVSDESNESDESDETYESHETRHSMAVATHRVGENAGGARRTKRPDVKSGRPCLLLFNWVCEIAASFLINEKCGVVLYTGNKLLAAIAGLHKQKQTKQTKSNVCLQNLLNLVWVAEF